MNVITVLKKLGCKVVDRETTDGAQKWWLTYPPGLNSGSQYLCSDYKTRTARQVILRAFRLDHTDYCHGEYLYHNGQANQSFTLEFQTQEMDEREGVFIAKPRKTKAGKQYVAGIDC